MKCCVEKPWSAERPLPDLAFFHRHTAPLIPIEYELDGESHSIFQLDRKRLELLAKLADQNVSPEELEGSGVREFIQAGLSSQGVLVMLRPNRERADLDLRWPRVIGS